MAVAHILLLEMKVPIIPIAVMLHTIPTAGTIVSPDPGSPSGAHPVFPSGLIDSGDWDRNTIYHSYGN